MFSPRNFGIFLLGQYNSRYLSPSQASGNPRPTFRNDWPSTTGRRRSADATMFLKHHFIADLKATGSWEVILTTNHTIAWMQGRRCSFRSARVDNSQQGLRSWLWRPWVTDRKRRRSLRSVKRDYDQRCYRARCFSSCTRSLTHPSFTSVFQSSFCFSCTLLLIAWPYHDSA